MAHHQDSDVAELDGLGGEGGQNKLALMSLNIYLDTYTLRPIIAYTKSEFVVGLTHDGELTTRALIKEIKNDFGDDVKMKDFGPVSCTPRPRKIDSYIRCVNPRHGFEFTQNGSFSHDIRAINRNPSIIYHELKSMAPKMNVALEFELREGDKPLFQAGFEYCWEPDQVKKVPHETSTVTVDEEAKKIEVGGCVVDFPAGTFLGSQPVTVTTEIDAENWPPGREGITPTFFLPVKILQKPATFALTSWCHLKDRDVGIDMMHFNENTKKWKVISPVIVKNESSLEFQSCEGGQYIGTLRDEQSSTARYVLRPIICFKNSDFAVALIRRTEEDRNQLMVDMKNNLGDDFKTKDFCPLPCTMTQTIDSCIKCANPTKGFKFMASGSFTHGIESIIKYSIPSYGFCQLKSDASKTNLTLEFELREGGQPLRKADCFQYCWEPDIPKASSLISTTDDENSETYPVEEEGEHVNMDMTSSSVNVLGGDQIHGKVINYIVNAESEASASVKTTTGEERLEDAFENISLRFASASEFEKFARAGNGLRLSFAQVDEIKMNKTIQSERRIAMVQLWSQREGKRGIPKNLRTLVDRYFESLNLDKPDWKF